MKPNSHPNYVLLERTTMLTKKQKEFADEYLETGNGTKAALKAYDIKAEDKEKCAAEIGSQNLRKLKVQEYLEQKSERAAEVIFELLENAQNETVKLNAGKDILDRAGHKPIERKDLTSGGKPIVVASEILQKHEIDESPINNS